MKFLINFIFFGLAFSIALYFEIFGPRLGWFLTVLLFIGAYLLAKTSYNYYDKKTREKKKANQPGPTTYTPKKINSTSDHDFIICPKCNTRQRSNRTRCFDCGAEFKE